MIVESNSSENIEYAGFWVRCLAFSIDYTIVSIPIVLSGVAIVLFSVSAQLSLPLYFVKNFAFIIGWSLLVIFCIYFIRSHSGYRQATLGKKLCCVYVGNIRDQSRLSVFTSAKRLIFTSPLLFLSGVQHKINFFAGSDEVVRLLIYSIWGVLLCCHLIAAFTEEKTALHDKLCGSRVFWGQPGIRGFIQKRSFTYYSITIVTLLSVWVLFLLLFKKLW